MAMKRADTSPGPDQSGKSAGPLVARGRDDLAPAVVVPNTLWESTDPLAYGGGRPTEITHLRDLDAAGVGRRDDARWSGMLEVIPTKADYVLDLIRANSLWPLLSGLACCAIEMMSAATSKNDMDRWGMFPFRASPRQADVLIVAGTLTTKMAGPLLRLWEQMPEPKWCVAMGDCTCSGGRYKRSYSTVEGIDRIMPVDVYVPGLSAPAGGPHLRDDEAPAAGQGPARPLAGATHRTDGARGRLSDGSCPAAPARGALR